MDLFAVIVIVIVSCLFCCSLQLYSHIWRPCVTRWLLRCVWTISHHKLLSDIINPRWKFGELTKLLLNLGACMMWTCRTCGPDSACWNHVTCW